MNTYPLLHNSTPNTPIFYYKDKVITHKEFKRDVLLLTENLAEHKYAINLCEDRYLFAIAFVACIIKEQVSLLPAHRAEKEIEEIENDYSDTQRINDNYIEKSLLKETKIKHPFPNEINSSQLIAIVFTSGSSGKPKANFKHWGALVDSAQRVASQLKLNNSVQHTLVATVPPQHMYGFETTVVLPLVAAVCVHNSKPFFPEDIRQTLLSLSKPLILITTPIHLRACTQAQVKWPKIDFILSATAPLTKQLAQDAEQQLNTTVQEIYGCSETGVIATRTTTQSSDWLLLPEYKLERKLNGICLITPYSNEETLLPDQVEQINSKQFRLLGRQSDLIKIAGKRGSLNDLKIKLCAIKGVDDAVFFMPDENNNDKTRVTALVVAPNLNIKEINTLLGQQIDNAFIPRPFIKVDKLPYNETGKLPRKNLLNLLNQHRNFNSLKNSA